LHLTESKALVEAEYRARASALQTSAAWSSGSSSRWTSGPRATRRAR